MIGYIYKTTNLLNGKIYIGQHKRSYFDENYKGSGSYITKAINKYGTSNFKVELLVPCFSIEELNEEEIYCIYHFNSNNRDIGYNITAGGLGHLNHSPSEETRKKLSEAGKNRVLSSESRMKISRANTGKVRSEEARMRLSIARRGKRFNLSEEAKAKISESNRRRIISESAHENMSLGSCSYIYIYNGINFYGDRKIMRYMRENGYPKFSNTTLKKLVAGLEIKGYANFSGKISRRLVGDVV